MQDIESLGSVANKKFTTAFSLLEVLFCLIIFGIIGSSALFSIVALKKQDVAIQKFLTQESSIYETQLFINRMLSIAKPDSIKISNNASSYILSFKGYDKLFLSASGTNNYMDFSLNASEFSISLVNNNLYFNNNLLLHNIKLFSAKVSNISNDKVLEYTLCSRICINDFVFLEDKEINF